MADIMGMEQILLIALYKSYGFVVQYVIYYNIYTPYSIVKKKVFTGFCAVLYINYTLIQ